MADRIMTGLPTQYRLFAYCAPAIAVNAAIFSNDAMAWNQVANGIVGDGVSYGAGGSGLADVVGHSLITDHCSRGDG